MQGSVFPPSCVTSFGRDLSLRLKIGSVRDDSILELDYLVRLTSVTG